MALPSLAAVAEAAHLACHNSHHHQVVPDLAYSDPVDIACPMACLDVDPVVYCRENRLLADHRYHYHRHSHHHPADSLGLDQVDTDARQWPGDLQ